MKLLQALFILILAVECLHAQVNKPLYVIDGEFENGQTSTLYRINPNDAAVLDVVGDTGEHLLAIAVDPETGDVLGLSASNSANADALVRIDPDTAETSLIVALVPPDGEEMPEFLDMRFGNSASNPVATASNPLEGISPLHFVLDLESGQLDPRFPTHPVIPGNRTGIANSQTAVPAPSSMAMFGCNDATGESSLVDYIILSGSPVPDPIPPPVTFLLPDQTCVTAGTRADGHTFYGVGVPFAEGTSRTLVRIDLAGDGSAEVETLGPLPDDAAGIAFGPIPPPSVVPTLNGAGRAGLIGLLLLAAGFMVRRTVRKRPNPAG